MMNDLFYPIGSVLLVTQSDRRVMVIGRLQKDKKSGETYDYIGCFFPEGIRQSEKVLCFNHKDILMPFSLGYQNEEEILLRQELRYKRRNLS